MKKQKESAAAPSARTILFGDNAFARGFWGRLLESAADKSAKDTETVLIRETPGAHDPLAYRLVCKGEAGVQERTVTRFVRAVDPFTDEEAFYSLADDPSLVHVLWSPAGTPWLLPDGKLKNDKYHPLAQLTMLLFRRFCLEKPGVTVIPATPEPFNGREVKKQICAFADLRGLGMDFLNWLNLEVRFVNTLAQCVVESFDGGCVQMENNPLFVLDRAGTFLSPVGSFAPDIGPYYTAKRFLYDGALASSCAYSLLHGVNTVSAFMAREKLARHLTVSLFEEIIPALHEDFAIQQSYAQDMLARIQNPRVTIPWDTSDLPRMVADSLVPPLLAYTEKENVPPRHLTFALACTIVWMRAREPENVLWQNTGALLSDVSLWGADLSFLAPDVRVFEEKIGG